MGHSKLFKGYKIQWAERSLTNPEYPASAWKTVSGAAHIETGEAVQAQLETLQAAYPERLFRGWLRG